MSTSTSFGQFSLEIIDEIIDKQQLAPNQLLKIRHILGKGVVQIIVLGNGDQEVDTWVNTRPQDTKVDGNIGPSNLESFNPVGFDSYFDLYLDNNSPNNKNSSKLSITGWYWG